MVHFPRIFSKHLSRFWSAKKLFQTSAPIFLPFYHVVSNQQLPYILNYPYLNEKQFVQELEYFLKYFKPVSLEELYKKPHTKQKIFHLSFDDGLRECTEMVAPILIKKGIPATFFINSGFTDNKDLFHRYKASLVLSKMRSKPHSEVQNLFSRNGLSLENILQTSFGQRAILDEAAELLEIDFGTFLQNTQPYLSTAQIKDLHNKGFSIGGHSHKHPEFWQIPEKKQFVEVKKSMHWLQENIQPKIKAFAFPYTDHGVSANFIKKLKTENICDITFGTAGVKYDEVNSHFQRYPAEQTGDFKENLKTEFVYYKLRKALGKATVKH